MVMTLDQAKAWLHGELDAGAECPCCGQFAKVYRRNLNSTMARGLIWLVQQAGLARMWVDVSTDGPKWLVSKGGTLATLRHWKLIEARANTDSAKRASGVWRPTTDGFAFAHGMSSTAKYVFLYAGTVQGYSAEMITVQQALGSKFNYGELMAPW